MLRDFGAQVLLTLKNTKVFWTIAFGCIFFAFAGPFGSFSEAPVTYRFAFWVPVFILAFITVAIVHAITLHVLRVKSLIASRIISYFVFTCLFTPLLYSIFFFGETRMDSGDPSFLIVMSWVLLTAGTCSGMFAVLNPAPVFSSVANDGPVQEELEPPRLFRRLDRNAKDVSITRLTVNDHYVIVGLSDGSEERLLMRLCDAIAEMDQIAGFTTHRSHWVSQSHIQGLVHEGRREWLELTTGVRVPISRTYRPVLVAAGVIPKAPEQPEAPSKLRSVVAQREA